MEHAVVLQLTREKSDAESREQSTDSKQSIGLFSRKDDKNEGMTVIADGKEYDLTGDFQQTVVKMTKNGLNILNPYAATIVKYDENGKLYNVPFED